MSFSEEYGASGSDVKAAKPNVSGCWSGICMSIIWRWLSKTASLWLFPVAISTFNTTSSPFILYVPGASSSSRCSRIKASTKGKYGFNATYFPKLCNMSNTISPTLNSLYAPYYGRSSPIYQSLKRLPLS